MNHQLIMLPNPILVSDEKIKDNDFMYRAKDGIVKAVPDFFWDFKEPYKKVIAGIPELPRLDLSLVDVGYVDVEKLAKEYVGRTLKDEESDEHFIGRYSGFKAGFNANPKKYTEADIIEFAEWLRYDKTANAAFNFNAVQEDGHVAKTSSLLSLWLVQRQPKVYNVEVEMEERYNRLDFDDDDMPTSVSPKITDNTIKVTKILS